MVPDSGIPYEPYRRPRAWPVAAVALVLATAAFPACGARVVGRASSPGGQHVAACLAHRTFDGPDYEVRLERPDGTPVRTLYRVGDGEPCGGLSWSPDGRLLAVTTAHVARVRLVDVTWALAHADARTEYWHWRQVDLSTEGRPAIAQNLRFVGVRDVTLDVCEAEADQPRASGPPACVAPGTAYRFTIPEPVVMVNRGR